RSPAGLDLTPPLYVQDRSSAPPLVFQRSQLPIGWDSLWDKKFQPRPKVLFCPFSLKPNRFSAITREHNEPSFTTAPPAADANLGRPLSPHPGARARPCAPLV